MQLIDVDAIQAQSLQASLNRPCEYAREMHLVGPLIRAGTGSILPWWRLRVLPGTEQRFGNQFLANVRAVGIRGVNEVDIQLHGPAKNP